jgi:hypothetical protein
MSDTNNNLPFPILPGEGVSLAFRIAHRHNKESFVALVNAINAAAPRLTPRQARALADAMNLHSQNVADLITVAVNDAGQHNHMTYYHEKWLGAISDANDNTARNLKMAEAGRQLDKERLETAMSINQLLGQMSKTLFSIHNHLMPPRED